MMMHDSINCGGWLASAVHYGALCDGIEIDGSRVGLGLKNVKRGLEKG